MENNLVLLNTELCYNGYTPAGYEIHHIALSGNWVRIAGMQESSNRNRKLINNFA
jgi:hypothetical protein